MVNYRRKSSGLILSIGVEIGDVPVNILQLGKRAMQIYLIGIRLRYRKNVSV